MDKIYNANMYLTPDDLNEVENEIYEKTLEIQQKIFDGRSSPLHTIGKGSYLDGATLYCFFDRNLYEGIMGVSGWIDYEVLISTNNGNSITYENNNSSDAYVKVNYNGNSYNIYEAHRDENSQDGYKVYVNFKRFKLPKDFGFVNDYASGLVVESCNMAIHRDEYIIPDYTPKEWENNEIAYIQDIDYIEQGIRNIGDYYNKPLGWIECKAWLNTGSITNNPTIDSSSIGIKPFSYQDINRWINNLNLTIVTEMEDDTIWNTDKSEYYWNEEDE